jgi:hypothetical protein
MVEEIASVEIQMLSYVNAPDLLLFVEKLLLAMKLLTNLLSSMLLLLIIQLTNLIQLTE